MAHALVAARLVRDLMRLCFLLERTYAPYAKWFGTAFRGLACGARLTPIFDAALAAATWREREAHLTPAYEIIAEMQNATGIAAPLPTAVSPFHDRPYRVIHGERFASAITEEIADPLLREVAAEIGSVNQLIDATDKLTKVAFLPATARPLRGGAHTPRFRLLKGRTGRMSERGWYRRTSFPLPAFGTGITAPRAPGARRGR